MDPWKSLPVIVLFGFSCSSVCFILDWGRKGKCVFSWFSQNHPGVSTIIRSLKLQLRSLLRVSKVQKEVKLWVPVDVLLIFFRWPFSPYCGKVLLNESCVSLIASTSSYCLFLRVTNPGPLISFKSSLLSQANDALAWYTATEPWSSWLVPCCNTPPCTHALSRADSSSMK